MCTCALKEKDNDDDFSSGDFSSRDGLGLAVKMTPTVGAEACGALKWEVARRIARNARTNVAGGASVSKEGDDLMVVARTTGTREMARQSCKTS